MRSVGPETVSMLLVGADLRLYEVAWCAPPPSSPCLSPCCRRTLRLPCCLLQGAYAGPVFGGMPSQRIFCNDSLPAAQCRYMESFERLHSNHGLSAQVAGGWAAAAVPRPAAAHLCMHTAYIHACMHASHQDKKQRPLINCMNWPLVTFWQNKAR